MLLLAMGIDSNGSTAPSHEAIGKVTALKTILSVTSSTYLKHQHLANFISSEINSTGQTIWLQKASEQQSWCYPPQGVLLRLTGTNQAFSKRPSASAKHSALVHSKALHIMLLQLHIGSGGYCTT